MCWRCQVFLSIESIVPYVFLDGVLTTQLLELSHPLHSLHTCIFVRGIVEDLVDHLKHVVLGVTESHSLSNAKVLSTVYDSSLLLCEWHT